MELHQKLASVLRTLTFAQVVEGVLPSSKPPTGTPRRRRRRPASSTGHWATRDREGTHSISHRTSRRFRTQTATYAQTHTQRAHTSDRHRFAPHRVPTAVTPSIFISFSFLCPSRSMNSMRWNSRRPTFVASVRKRLFISSTVPRTPFGSFRRASLKKLR